MPLRRPRPTSTSTKPPKISKKSKSRSLLSTGRATPIPHIPTGTFPALIPSTTPLRSQSLTLRHLLSQSTPSPHISPFAHTPPRGHAYIKSLSPTTGVLKMQEPLMGYTATITAGEGGNGEKGKGRKKSRLRLWIAVVAHPRRERRRRKEERIWRRRWEDEEKGRDVEAFLTTGRGRKGEMPRWEID